MIYCSFMQLLKTNEEMRSVAKELVRLKESLARNENRFVNPSSANHNCSRQQILRHLS